MSAASHPVLFQQVLDHLVSVDPGGGVLLLMSQRFALVGGVDGPVAVLLVPAGAGAAAREELLALLEHLQRGRLHVVLCGEQADRLLVGGVLLAEPTGGLALVELEAPDQRFAGPPTPVGEWLGAALGAVERRPGLLPLPPAGFSARMGAALRRQKSDHADLNRFARAMGQRRPVLTMGLLGALVLVYLLTEMDGGQRIVEAGLLKAGAQSLREPWRLLGSVFLHGGLLHLGLNAFALWDLGGLVERLIGARRMLVVFTLSGLLGALMAGAFSRAGQGTLGASGAVFGLMATAGVLSVKGAALFPPAVAQRLRKLSLQSLVINAAISLLPGVSWQSHLGGALSGLLLGASGVLLTGLRRPTPGEPAEVDGEGGAWALAAGLCGAMLSASVGAMLLAGLR